MRLLFRAVYLGFYSFYRQFNRNRLFNDPQSFIGDNLMYPFVYAGKRLQELGHRVATIDMDDLEKFDAVIFFDHPTMLNPYFRKLRKMPEKKLYVFLFENQANRPDNFWKSNHAPFEKIFTWQTDLIDHKKYFPFWFPLKIPAPYSIDRKPRPKFSVTIASQKYNPHRSELYSERVRMTRWFEKEHPDKFDLYGQGWDRRYITGSLSRFNLVLQKVYSKFPNSLKSHRFPSWRGAVKSKNETMRDYKFALCFENAVFPGYVTEKMFDGLFAGCVPIYLGAPDITDFVPAHTFIDMRKFKNYEGLYRYLEGMPAQEYERYLDAIEKFVRGERIQLFSPENFVNIICKEIIQ